MSLVDRLTRAWYAPRAGAIAVVLAPFAWAYGAVVRARRALYRRGVFASRRAGVPVVVVGNLVAGGSGKTPLALALAEALAARGWHPGFVSRGYGRRDDAVRIVAAGDDADSVGDEPLLLAASGFPVAVGRDRAAAARRLVDAHAAVDVVIADDGLQHYALARDVEIAVIDATRGLGNGRLLPAGPLREPSGRLAEVDAVVRLVDAGAEAAGGDGRETTMTHEPLRWRNLADPARTVAPRELAASSPWAIAGTGHPARFFALVRSLGIDARTRAFPDHHAYAPADLDLPGADAILMTAKDAVKCAAFADARAWALDIRARIEPALVDRVEEKLRGSQAARHPRLPGDQGPARLRP